MFSLYNMRRVHRVCVTSAARSEHLSEHVLHASLCAISESPYFELPCRTNTPSKPSSSPPPTQTPPPPPPPPPPPLRRAAPIPILAPTIVCASSICARDNCGHKAVLCDRCNVVCCMPDVRHIARCCARHGQSSGDAHNSRTAMAQQSRIHASRDTRPRHHCADM